MCRRSFPCIVQVSSDVACSCEHESVLVSSGQWTTRTSLGGHFQDSFWERFLSSVTIGTETSEHSNTRYFWMVTDHVGIILHPTRRWTVFVFLFSTCDTRTMRSTENTKFHKVVDLWVAVINNFEITSKNERERIASRNTPESSLPISIPVELPRDTYGGNFPERSLGCYFQGGALNLFFSRDRCGARCPVTPKVNSPPREELFCYRQMFRCVRPLRALQLKRCPKHMPPPNKKVTAQPSHNLDNTLIGLLREYLKLTLNGCSTAPPPPPNLFPRGW